MFKCYKNVKKLFRKLSRQCIYDRNNELYQSLDSLLVRDANAFWKSIRKTRKPRSCTSVNIDTLVNHYTGIMQDNGPQTAEHKVISKSVSSHYTKLNESVITSHVSPEDVDKVIAKLKRNSSPGIDGVTAEFLIYGRSGILCQHLAALYSNILTHNYVPSVFATGVLVPVLKKSTLNPTVPSNYRPITVSSVFAKLFEILILPTDTDLCTNQFGFRADYSVSHGLSLLNDVLCYYKHHNSNIFLCSLDAEKCFDSIWHDGMFYKLINVLPDVQWRLLYNWYASLVAVIKWDGHIHHQSSFRVTRGTRQGSILSPLLFNIFLSDLMSELKRSDSGLRIGDDIYNSFAYADDISLFSATVPGLQRLINICSNYAKQWRFNFGLQKSQCMIGGKNSHCFITDPVWHLDGNPMKTSDDLEILGVTFSGNNKFDKHVQLRSQKCRKSMYSLNSIGMCYPGLNSVSKSHLYKSICLPTLCYGLESINITDKCMKTLESTQGGIMKQVCGLSKISRHSNLLRALDIDDIRTRTLYHTKSLFNRLCSVPSPTRNLCIYMMSQYITKGLLIPGSIIDRLVKSGVSPIQLMYNKPEHYKHIGKSDGVVDSLRNLLFHEHFIKPWSNEYLLVKLLTKSF